MNRVLFKQMFQAEAIDFCQLDSARLGERQRDPRRSTCMAKKFGVPVCPHAGGVGLCELVQHLSIFDYVAVSGTLENRVTEYVDHLHEHFVDPCIVEDGAYRAADGARLQRRDARRDPREPTRFPSGSYWSSATGSASSAATAISGADLDGMSRGELLDAEEMGGHADAALGGYRAGAAPARMARCSAWAASYGILYGARPATAAPAGSVTSASTSAAKAGITARAPAIRAVKRRVRVDEHVRARPVSLTTAAPTPSRIGLELVQTVQWSSRVAAEPGGLGLKHSSHLAAVAA